MAAAAAELKLDWHTVKTLDQQYMEVKLKRAGTPSPRVIGIDEIAGSHLSDRGQ
jgi:transposase